MTLNSLLARGRSALAAGLIATTCFMLSDFTAPRPAQATCFTSSGSNSNVAVTFNSCTAQATLRVVGCFSTECTQSNGFLESSHLNISWGQRAKSDAAKGPVFSAQRERAGNMPTYILGTRPKSIPVVAYFRAQLCSKKPLGTSSCYPWGPTLTLDLGYNELTAYS